MKRDGTRGEGHGDERRRWKYRTGRIKGGADVGDGRLAGMEQDVWMEEDKWMDGCKGWSDGWWAIGIARVSEMTAC